MSDYDNYDDTEFPDEQEFSEWIDNQYQNWAIAMGFDETFNIQKWIETEMEDGDYYV